MSHDAWTSDSGQQHEGGLAFLGLVLAEANGKSGPYRKATGNEFRDFWRMSSWLLLTPFSKTSTFVGLVETLLIFQKIEV